MPHIYSSDRFDFGDPRHEKPVKKEIDYIETALWSDGATSHACNILVIFEACEFGVIRIVEFAPTYFEEHPEISDELEQMRMEIKDFFRNKTVEF